ncbi:MAG TPA: exodeoxyribonuclease III [Cyclobacteriaceae bacterium]|jgi:exodeoxyribonuclease-3
MANTLKIVSWNVNGIRAIVKKDFIKSINRMNPDILCLQETKAPYEEVKTVSTLLNQFPEVHINSSKARKGYSGTAIFLKNSSAEVKADMGIQKHDQEGRVLTASFPGFFLVTVYTPNSGRGLERLKYRTTWDTDFMKFIKNLEKEKPVIVCGDLNVAHQAIDLANPKSNYNKTAGYTQDEIDGFSRLLESGFVDIFRKRNPELLGVYTYWNYMFNARQNNKGWRIDYFLISESLVQAVVEAEVYPEFHGSDHCPVGLVINT